MPSAALERHPAVPCAALRGIEASVSRAPGGSLKVLYRLDGEIDRLRIPPARSPRSARRLWEHTCCELFVARELPGYREFNFSPSGEWAGYAFARYREGAPLAVPDPGINVTRDAGWLELSATIAENHPGKIRIGLCAVIEDEAGALSYWALRHSPGKPDFHHADAFELTLE